MSIYGNRNSNRDDLEKQYQQQKAKSAATNTQQSQVKDNNGISADMWNQELSMKAPSTSAAKTGNNTGVQNNQQPLNTARRTAIPAASQPAPFTQGSPAGTQPSRQQTTVTPWASGNNGQNNSSIGAYQRGADGLQADALMQQISNREKFSYDLASDPMYQQYKQQAMMQGQQAMMDAMGQASAMTGGYGSSYAQNGGQQAYQGYLQNLNDQGPQLYQMAMDQYNQQGQQLMDQYALYADRENQNYNRYLDSLDRLERADQTAYDRAQDEKTWQWNEDDRIYNREQDALNRAERTEQTAYDREQDAEYWRRQDEQTAYDREQDDKNWAWKEDDRDYNRELDAYNRQVAEEKTTYDREQDAE